MFEVSFTVLLVIVSLDVSENFIFEQSSSGRFYGKVYFSVAQIFKDSVFFTFLCDRRKV